MDDNLASVVTTASALLAEAVIADPKYVERLGDLDARLKEGLREIGRRASETVYRAAARKATERLEAEGLKAERRPTITFHVLFGPIEVESPYLWSGKGGRSARPVKDELGLEHLGKTQALERALTDFGAEESFGQAAKRFEEHYGWAVGRTSILRLVEGVASEAETFVEKRFEEASKEFDQPLAQRLGAEHVLVELDGGEIRTGKLVPAPEGGKTAVLGLPKRLRETEWRDVRIGLARQLDEVEPTYVGKLAPYPEVVGQLFGAACMHGLSQRTKVVACSDGGNGIREEIETQFPNVQYVLDHAHAKSQFYETADAKGLKGDEREKWVAHQMARLHEGDVQLALDELAAHKGKGKARVVRLHEYLTRFKDAVHYDAFEKAGFPRGSGEVESAHRTIPQKRLKLPGAWWLESNVNPMLALRVLRANGWWNEFWTQRKAA